MELHTDVREQYLDFAAYADGSPCLRDWALAVADDEELLAWLAGLPPLEQQPNLVFAAARWHGVAAPGPYDGLRAALLADAGAIRGTISSRSTQTNEVGRLATLVPFLAELGHDPVVLLEVGASAGLCLYPDRWSYEWHTAAGPVRAGEGPRLTCEVTGELPATSVPGVAWRGGVDLNPLDVTDDDAMAWLATLVWPEHEERRARLRVGIEVARHDPPQLRRGDLLELLPELVADAATHGPVVVFHTAVIAYLETDDRARFHQMMTELVADGRCHWISNEGKRVLPEVTRTGPEVPEEMATFVLGVDGRARAWTHGHGASMTVLS
ncbi:DUF2332 domain-containing protein [Nocardioides coralli]|uniref:DUF2332 domain-containing protein n=1 Tax=Nocardioides coralli TaxID=2872154 RepID=UPI001CA3B48F|nr:DUF2332 domain-containing protein [Nocardioides coralli]QZY29054.1 DUF2332 domain-containing protein [Nocardioides coralli]